MYIYIHIYTYMYVYTRIIYGRRCFCQFGANDFCVTHYQINAHAHIYICRYINITVHESSHHSPGRMVCNI